MELSDDEDMEITDSK